MTPIHATTTRLRLVWRDRLKTWLAQRDPLVLLASVIAMPLIAILIGTAMYRAISAPAVAVVPTPSLPIILIATARAQALPTAAAQPVAYAPPVVRWVTAFAAPNGDVLGPIMEPAMDAITGRWGDDWLSTPHDGATVWIRVADLGGSLANVAPAPPPVVLVQPAPAYQVDSAPEEAAPTPAAAAAPPPVDARTLNIQQHYANDRVTPVPIAPITDVQKEWIRVESCTEHPDWCK